MCGRPSCVFLTSGDGLLGDHMGVKEDYQCWDWWNDHICLGGRISENVRGQGAVLGVLVNNSNQESTMVYSLAYDSFIIE